MRSVKRCFQKDVHKIRRKRPVSKTEKLQIPKAVKKRLWHKKFPVNLGKFLRTPFLQNASGLLLLLLTFQKQPLKVFYEKRCSMKKDVLENFVKITRKHLWFAKFSKTPSLQNTSGRLILAFSCNVTKMGYCQQCLENFR